MNRRTSSIHGLNSQFAAAAGWYNMIWPCLGCMIGIANDFCLLFLIYIWSWDRISSNTQMEPVVVCVVQSQLLQNGKNLAMMFTQPLSCRILPHQFGFPNASMIAKGLFGTPDARFHTMDPMIFPNFNRLAQLQNISWDIAAVMPLSWLVFIMSWWLFHQDRPGLLVGESSFSTTLPRITIKTSGGNRKIMAQH